MILIIGPNNSGKSKLAENIICENSNNKYYIATMKNEDGYNNERIERHRLMRASKGFFTIEEPFTLDNCEVDFDSSVLLEDASNLLANNIFIKNLGTNHVLKMIKRLDSRCKELVVVSIDGLNASEYEGETRNYIDELNTLNKELSRYSDITIKRKIDD